MNDSASADIAPSWLQARISNPGCDVTLQTGTTIDAHTSIDITSPNRVTTNGTPALTGSVNAGCLANSGAVRIRHE